MRWVAAALVVVALLVVGVAVPGSSRAAFPGANGKIVFDSDRSGAKQVYVMPGSGGAAVQLTDESSNDSPTWSPDGTKIAFVSERDGQDEIYVMNADGSQETPVTSGPERAASPAWSSDGQKIVFIRINHSDSHYSIWTVDSGGGTPVELINLAGEDTMPAFSPDGSRIAFSHADPGGDFQIYVADANGNNAAPVTSGGFSHYFPDWSPDSNRIAYLCRPDTGDDELCVVDADAGNDHAVTNNSFSDGYPAWSPDGTRIAFESDGVDGYGIYTMEPDGGDVQPLSATGDEYEPDWQPLSSTPTATATPDTSVTPTPTATQTLTQGDVNCDGNIDTADFMLVIEFAAGVSDGVTPGACPDVGGAIPTGAVSNVWGDFNCDSQVSAYDALQLLAYPEIEIPHPDCRDIGQAFP